MTQRQSVATARSAARRSPVGTQSSTTKPLAVIRACGLNVQAVARSLTPSMLSKQFIQQIVRLELPSTTHHECRHRGYSVKKDVDECPQCGSDEIAAYDLE